MMWCVRESTLEWCQPHSSRALPQYMMWCVREYIRVVSAHSKRALPQYLMWCVRLH
jgi:hypothetical protein